MKWIATAMIFLTSTLAFGQQETCIFTHDSAQAALAIVKVGGKVGGGGTRNGESILQTTDVKRFRAADRSQMTRLNQNTKALELVYNLGLDIPWKQVQSAIVTVLNNDDNRTDFSGALLVTFYDIKKEVLLRVGQVGLMAGICQESSQK